MSAFGVVLPAAGMGTRLEAGVPKAFVSFRGEPLFIHALRTFASMPEVGEIILVLPTAEITLAQSVVEGYPELSTANIQYVEGGKERQDSVRNGLALVKSDFVAIHDAARPFVTTDIIRKVFLRAKEVGAAIAGHKATDTVKMGEDYISSTPPRNQVWHAQTPQIFRTSLIKEAHHRALEQAWEVTDDASLFERIGEIVALVSSPAENKKITFKSDVEQRSMNKVPFPRIGFGYDVHQLVEGRKLILGGVEIDHEKGLLGHSDADVLLHAITDALFGAAALGDIGAHFPDTDPSFKGADSRKLLRECADIVRRQGYQIGNVDATVVAERPKLLPYIDTMRKHIASDLGIELDCVSIKATTSEKMGFVGRKEGMACHAVAMVFKQAE